MTPEQMAQAMKAGCPPEVAARSRFPRAMDRAWAQLNEGKVYAMHPMAGSVNIAHRCPSQGGPSFAAGPLATVCPVVKIPMYHVFRDWHEGECQECGLLFCGRFLCM